jgi:hypothetical protein
MELKQDIMKHLLLMVKLKNRLIKEDPKSADIIKPILRGRDIKRYYADVKDLWLINTHNGYKFNNTTINPIDITEYKVIKNHLDKYNDKLKKRYDQGYTLYNLRNCAYLEEFKKDKIMFQVNGAAISNLCIQTITNFVLILEEL